MTEIDKRSKKECLAVISNPDSSAEEIKKAQARIKAIEEWAKSQNGDKPTRSSSDVVKTNYGAAPDGEEFTAVAQAWKNYAALAASIVDSVQPNLDPKVRGQAVSATIGQLIGIRQVEKLTALLEQ